MENSKWNEAIDRIMTRIDNTVASQLDYFPHYADPTTGIWTTTPNGDWTGGFWIGLLWLAHKYTLDPKYVRSAEYWLEKLRKRINSQTVFRGFLFYYGGAIAEILFANTKAREIALLGAEGLCKLYNEKAKLIPLGAEAEEASHVGLAETNVDCVMLIALLSWASEKTGNQKLREMGVQNARSHVRLCVRDDGSVCQSASFDTNTGRFVARYTHKGFSDDSTWSRAQAWGMLGYSLAAASAPHEEEFLKVAIKVSDWWIDHVPEDKIAFWDFDDPKVPLVERDTSATAIATSSLLKLSKLVKNSQRQKYIHAAEETLENLVNHHMTPLHENESRSGGMLLHGCYNKKIKLATNNELVWGDYFFLEGLLDLNGSFGERII